MQALSELIHLSNSLKINSQESGNVIFEPKFKLLEKVLLEEKFSTDEEAILSIYGKEQDKKTFQKLKDRLRYAITGQILSKNLSRHFNNNYSNAKYNCMGAVFAGNILIMKVRRNAAIDLFEIALSVAQRYFFTELQLICLRNLRIETLKNEDKQKTALYNSKFKEVLKTYQAEMLMESYYNEIISPFVWKTDPRDFNSSADKIFKNANKLLEKFDSFNMRIYYYRVLIKYYHLKNKNRLVIKTCDKALNYLEMHRSIAPEIWFGEFNLEKMENAMLLMDYETGSQCAKECSHYFRRSFNNMMIFMEYYFLICLHTGHYFEAGQVYKKTVNKTFLSKARKSSIEKWKIFRCYLTLVQPENFRNMRNGTIDPELFTTAQDKTGYNLALVISELIHLLQTNQINKFEAREEPFKIYVYRYIKEKYFPRSYNFCRMILSLYKHSLNRTKVIQSAFKYEQKLNSIKELEHFEVIPYEDLWKIILNKLEANQYESTSVRRVG